MNQDSIHYSDIQIDIDEIGRADPSAFFFHFHILLFWIPHGGFLYNKIDISSGSWLHVPNIAIYMHTISLFR